ncbi:MAG: TonB-dependent receptor plug domain-containing protein [Nitrospirota bacterium]
MESTPAKRILANMLRPCPRLLRLIVTWIVLAAPVGGYGEPGPSTDLAEESILFLDIPSVYGASKYEQAVAEAPSSVSIVTADEIQKYGYRTLADILRSVRGFFVTYDRNYSYVGVRGFGRPGDYNTRVLFLLDGHRLNDNVYDGALLGTDGLLDVDLIKQVEIIRGPSSSLYGTSAFFGVINIVTKRGRDVAPVEASAEVASLDTHKARLTYGKRFVRGPELLVSGTWYDSEGNPRLLFPELNNPATNNGVAERVDADQFGSGFVKLGINDLTLHGGYSSRTKVIPTASYGSVFNDPRTRTVDARGFLELTYDHQWDARSSTKVRLFYDSTSYRGDYAFDYASSGDPPNVVINHDTAEGRWWGGEVTMAWALGRTHRVLLGAEYKGDLELEQRNYDVAVYVADKRRAANWALYVQDEVVLSKRLLLNVGVRHDQHDNTFGGTTSPRLAVIYTAQSDMTLKLLYGQAFRAPTFYELYYQDSLAQKANPDLDPEMMTSTELVVERSLTDHLLGIVSFFHYRIDDLISFETDPSDGLLVFRNAETIETNGMEIELDGRWRNGLEGRVSYAYQHSENQQTEEPLTNSPKYVARYNVIVPVVPEALFAGLETQYTSSRRTLLNNRVRAFYVTNATLFGRTLSNRLQLSVSVYNVFGTDYGDPGSQEHVQQNMDVIAQDGRAVRVKLTYAF